MANIIVKAKKKESLAPEVAIGKGIYRPMIRSRHPSHDSLRRGLIKLPFRSVIRLGSSTVLDDRSTKDGSRIELNSINAIKNSSNKLLMKKCFKENSVKTAEWIQSPNLGDIEGWATEFPIVAKSYFGSRGKGNTLIKTSKELLDFSRHHNVENYVFEKYYNYNKEYRLHISKYGCFYTCRKMLKQEFREHPNAWQRHDDNCVWILEENENFDRPANWSEIVRHCVMALESCGLDFGACDLRVQNNQDKEGNNRENPDFIVVEINSAPSFGQVTLEKYKEVLPQLLLLKNENR